MLRNTLAVLEEWGGVTALEKENAAKAELLYGTIDANAGFWRAPVAKSSRSTMNVVWRLPTEELEKKFLAQANAVSWSAVYARPSNAARLADVEKLVAFMNGFAKKNA